jgi:hypothetical protein
MLKQYWPSILAPVLLIYFVLVSLSGLLYTYSQTFDEGSHFEYGMNILAGNSTRFDDSKMPVSALNAVPKTAASLLPAGALADMLGRFAIARLVTVAVSVGVAVLVFCWSRSLYGLDAGLASLFLYVFDPNIVAHSQLVTTDLYAAGTIALAFYCLWRFARTRTVRSGLTCAVALGISQLAKYTAVVLFPLFALTMILADLPAWRLAYRADGASGIAKYLRRASGWAAVALATSLAIVNVGFLFNRSFTPFGNYRFRSTLFQDLQQRHPAMSAVPVPAPYPYLEGLDWVIQRERTGAGYGRIYLLGRLQEGRGFNGYYLVASVLKVPIGTQLLVMAACLVYFSDRHRRARFLTDEVFLAVPVVFFVVYFNFFYNAQIGIRHYLVVTPLLYVFTGQLFANVRSFMTWQKATVGLLCAYTAISVWSYHPDYLAYFNEIVWDRSKAYRFLADSNLDWGQSAKPLAAYLTDHPDAIFEPSRPVAGHLVVAVNDLVGIEAEPAKFAWLRNNFEPVGTVAHSFLIYRISTEQISRVCGEKAGC